MRRLGLAAARGVRKPIRGQVQGSEDRAAISRANRSRNRARTDFQNRAGADRLDYSRLFSAVFEMADLWCPGLAVEEYVSFLDALEFRARGALAEIDALEASSFAAGLA